MRIVSTRRIIVHAYEYSRRLTLVAYALNRSESSVCCNIYPHYTPDRSEGEFRSLFRKYEWSCGYR